MKRFRFMGDPKDYMIPFVKGNIYDGDIKALPKVDESITIASILYPNDWQVVFETDSKPLHKDTDLGVFSIQLLSAKYQDGITSDNYRKACESSIRLAKELIKQLNEENNG